MDKTIIKGREFVKYLSSEQVIESVKELSNQINDKYKDKEIYFLVVLNGAFMFASDLFKHIKGNHKISFIKISSYNGMSSTGNADVIIGLNDDIKDKNVIIIEDIIDTGNSMEHLLGMLKDKQASSIEVCTLMFKPNCFKKDFEIGYIGREITDEFIIGYGFDYDGYGRNFPDIYQLKE